MKRLSNLGRCLTDFGDLKFALPHKDSIYNILTVNPCSVDLGNQELAEAISRPVASGYSHVVVAGGHPW